MDQQDSGRAVAVTGAGTGNVSPAIEIAGKTVHRLGVGAMRLGGPGVWGEPPDPGPYIRLMRRAVELSTRGCAVTYAACSPGSWRI